ncbi:MAG: ATP-binding protein [Chloroflexota bacterium]
MTSVLPHKPDILRTLMQASMDSILMTGDNGHIVALSDSAERLFGYAQADVMLRPLTEIITLPSTNGDPQSLAHYMETDDGPALNRRIEVTGIHRSGTRFPAEMTIIPTEVDEQPVFLTFIRDISERKGFERVIRRTSVRFQKLITSLQGGVLVEDETRHIVLVNHAFCDMFNIPVPARSLYASHSNTTMESSKSLFANPAGFIQRVDEILKSEQTVTEETLLLADGRVFSRDYVPVFHDEDHIGHLWHYRDITESYQSQRRWRRMYRFEAVNKEINSLFLQLADVDDALNRTLAITGQLMDVSRVYAFRFRENERILDNTHEWCAPGVTSEMEHLQGLPFDSMLPSFFPLIAEQDYIAPRHITDLPEDLHGVLEAQGIQTVLWMPFFLNERIEGFIGYDEVRAPREWLPEEITMARIIAENYARALERVQADRLLIEARDEAIHTAQLRAQFVANMSHEIRTPMTGIMGMQELLLETDLNDLQTEFASEALKSSKRLLTIINDILDFSKLEAGQVILESTPIDLRAIATEVRMTLMPQLKAKPVDILLDVAPDVPYRVHGDATRIRQVLMNLAGNAVKFTHNGNVTLAMRVAHTTERNVHIRFAVNDTGIGITEDNLTRIFDSFVQADGSTTRKYGGSGLGLSISKQLVELMGGTLAATSEHGTGSTFTFTLRLPIARADSTMDHDPARFSDISVLLIDRNRTARYVLAQQLEGWGATVTQVSSMEYIPAGTTYDIILHRYPDPTTSSATLEQIGRHVACIVSDRTQPPPDVVALRQPVDQSTLYNLLIQATQTHTNTTEATAPPPQNPIGHILVADDYPINIHLVRRALAQMHVHIDFVENGQQAIEAIQNTHYDLILMDIHMPIMDGVAATQHIRAADAPFCDVPILALTASVMRDEQDRYLAAGMNDVISKPFSVSGLRKVVQHWLEQPPTTD